MKTWWYNNSHRFWAIRWAWAGDPFAALEEWQEYKHMTNPEDDRSLTEQILEDYDADIEAAFRNPLVQLAAWVRWYPWVWLQGVGDRLSSFLSDEKE